MNLNELKRRLQNHITDGLVIIVGSGLSAQSGMPTMRELADHIVANPPVGLAGLSENQWAQISAVLRGGTDLETAMGLSDLDTEIEKHIVHMTATLIRERELPIVRETIAGTRMLPLTRLFRHLLPIITCLPVVTTNYDRLIELAADVAGIAVDSMFAGHLMCAFDPAQSHEALGYATRTKTRIDIKRIYRKHVKVLKPHGSIDWFSFKDSPVRCDLPIDLPRLMITPGKTKYVKGYEIPFDAHRNAANDAIERAARFLVLGFGFNDKQLEVHLRPQIKNGRDCIIMSKELTPNAMAVLNSSTSVLALSEAADNGSKGTLASTRLEKAFFPGISLWNLDSFLTEVLS